MSQSIRQRLNAERCLHGDRQPPRKNPTAEPVEHHGQIDEAPSAAGTGIEIDDYLQFLKVRSELILQEIERLTGLSTAPPQDQRHKAIEHLESRLRDVIHNALNEGHGAKYWKEAIPYRRMCAMRLKSALR